MWVRRTPEEISKAKHQRQSGRIRLAALSGIFIAILTAFTRGSKFIHGPGLIPLNQVASRLPSSIFFGLISGIVFYFWSGRGKTTVVCPKCGKVKFEDGSQQCSCGGHFENIEEMKWHEHK
jgi:hypothetical protein